MKRPGVAKCPHCDRNPGLGIGYGGETPATKAEPGEDIVFLRCLHCGANGPIAKVQLCAKPRTKLMVAVRAWNIRA